jgi:exonuclease VII large subunit
MDGVTILSLCLGLVGGFLVCFLLLRSGWLHRLGTFTPSQAHGWLWKDSEPAKLWTNLLITILGGLLVGWMIARSEQRLTEAQDEREYAQRLFDYRREQLDRLSHSIGPAIGSYYTAHSFRIWLYENQDNKESAQLAGKSHSELYWYWKSLQAEMDKEKDPIATAALIQGLCIENSQAVEPLEKLIAVFNNMPECMKMDELERHRTEANELTTRIARALAQDLKAEMNRLQQMNKRPYSYFRE